MNKSQFLAFLGVLLVPVVAIISEVYTVSANTKKLYVYVGLVVLIFFVGLIMVFSSKVKRWIMKIPDTLGILRRGLTWLMNFIVGPFMKGIFFVLVVAAFIISNTFLIKLTAGILLSIMYFVELQQKKVVLPWLQGRRPKFQDGFNHGLEDKWKVVSGSFFWEKNFGNPAPDLLLKQVGNPSATPQTFATLKNVIVRKPATIECDVYIEPGGIFNFAFGISIEKDSYLMARLDSRSTEFDALLYKAKGSGWTFLARSDKHRSTPKTWHRVKLDISSDKKVNFYKDGELIISRELEVSAYGNVGIMNEEGDVHIDNLVITET